MKTKSIVALGTILMIIAFPPLATAQDRFWMNAFGTLGVTRYEVSISTGLNAGGGMGWRPFGRQDSALRGIEIGGELNFSPDITGSPGGLSTRLIATGDVRYHFALSSLEPFVGFSLGFADFTRNPGGRSTPGNPPADSIGALATGIAVGIHDHWFLRPEFRGYSGIWRGRISGPGGNERHLYRISVAIGYRW